MRYFSLLILLLTSSQLWSQIAPDKYWVQFLHKDNTPYSIDQPLEFLSQKALDRRDKSGMEVNQQDLPVDPDFIQQVLAIGDSVYLINTSRWFNAITIETPDSLLIQEIANLPFVSATRSVQAYELDPKSDVVGARTKSHLHNESLYGPSFNQIEMMNGHLLHELGFHGEGMDIAVMDAGWINLYKLPIFDKMIDEGRLGTVWDFVDGGTDIHHHHDHGMYVLSTMSGWMPDSLVGTGYGATFHLFRTEDVSYENIIEEDNWVAAVEFADSLGVDLINTSLGYSLMDDSLASHSYEDLDGNSTRITIASDLAAQRGILLVTSAGNSGNDPWHFITAPADADSTLTVGAVDVNGTHVPFSGFGPTYDGRVKPDVMAQGLACVIANHDSTIRTGNGTSFSSPIMCGLTACLWQAHPERTNMEIIDAIRRSATLHPEPNDSMGYGIPNFWIAHQFLSVANDTDSDLFLKVYPNPFKEYLIVRFDATDELAITVRLIDMAGRQIPLTFEVVSDGLIRIRRLEESLANLPSGVYVLELSQGDKLASEQIIKN